MPTLDLTLLPGTSQQRRPPAGCGPQDPSNWDAHVVRALCSRSSAKLTSSCNSCGSVFHPCLCQPGERLAPQANVLCVPRIVRIAEQRRIVHNEQRKVSKPGRGRPLSAPAHKMGNLTEVVHSVQKVAEMRSKDLTRLVVAASSGETAVANVRSLIAGTCTATNIAWRDGDQYFLHRPSPKTYEQVLCLTEQELPEVDQRMSRSRDTDTVIWSKTVSVEYETPPANGDLILEESQPGVWEVQSVKEGGIADVAKVRAGHRLLMIRRPHERLSFSADIKSDGSVLHVPECFQGLRTDEDASCVGDGDSVGFSFPCILCFDQLPFGWKREGQVDRGPHGMSVRFVRDCLDCVERSRTSCRHEFAWERELATNALRDEDLWQDWVIGCGMSLSTMAVVAKKLADRSLQEMQEFEGVNEKRLEVLLGKCERLLELRQLQQTQSQEQQDVKVCRRIAQQTRQGSHGIGGLCEEVEALLKGLPRSWVQALAATAESSSSSSSIAEQMRLSNRVVNKVMHSLSHDLKEEVSKEARHYLQDVKSDAQRELHRSDPLLEQPSPGAAKRGYVNQQLLDIDGQLSLREFERTLILSGVHWLTRSHVFKLFSTLDMDRTGKASLEEVLYVTQQLQDLVKEAWAYGELQQSAGIFLSEAKLIEEFGNALQERRQRLSPRLPDQLKASMQRTMDVALQRTMKVAVASNSVRGSARLPLETEDQLRKLFKQCDKNGDGFINRRELIKACRASSDLADSLGLPHNIREGDSRDRLERFFQHVDADGNNQLSWNEFIDALGNVSRDCEAGSGQAVEDGRKEITD